MVYAHMRYSDKPFMGSVTAPERAQDTVEMCKILFGDNFYDPDVYARANQATVISPFILAGAMSPVTVAGTAAQILAEALAGMAFVQLVRPGAPVVFGTFASSISMQSGAPTFGTPEPSLVMYIAAALARRLGVPFRSGGGLCASKVPDAQAAYESANTLQTAALAGVNFMLHTAGWLEGGLVMSYGCSHTQANFETAFYRSTMSDNNSYEQWESEGSKDAAQRANEQWKAALEGYQPPEIDASVDQALVQYMAERKAAFPDANY